MDLTQMHNIVHMYFAKQFLVWADVDATILKWRQTCQYNHLMVDGDPTLPPLYPAHYQIWPNEISCTLRHSKFPG